MSEEIIKIKITNKIKTSAINRSQPVLTLPYFRENSSLCVASILKKYLNRTQHIRLQNDSKLFKKPNHPATSQTISRWIKSVLKSSGIDISKYTAHSTRHASTSKAARSGVNIDTIKNTAGWTKKSETFNKFYNNRPLG